jgi:NTE family protein
LNLAAKMTFLLRECEPDGRSTPAWQANTGTHSVIPPSPPEESSFWSGLGPQQQSEIKSASRARLIARGETLIEQDSAAETMYIVNFGLFEVKHVAAGPPVAEIGAGQLIGEIGFFAGAPRTASVIAARDSEVLEINRAGFDALTARFPEIQRAVTRALGKRLVQLAENVRVNDMKRPHGPWRMVAIVPAGAAHISNDFLARLRGAVLAQAGARFLTADDVAACFNGGAFDRYALANWLSETERRFELVVCVVDFSLSDWTQAALRSSDQALFVAGGSPEELNAVESLALELFPKARRRLVQVEARRSGYAAPSAPWLRRRDVFMAHHVALQDDEDFYSLARFLSGHAIGYVAGGGGAFGPAHVGIYSAFRESGIVFDIHGGSSVGSAMAAAFSLLMDPQDIKAAMKEMFVRRRALKRMTFPRYGLLDHRVFDKELRLRYGAGAIEDLWRPYFAVAADLSTYAMRVMREGPLWQAIRASCAIPGVLPPFFDDAGHMLVDGGVMDNVPVSAMNALKSGPNLVVDLRPREHNIFDVRYDSIPGPGELLARAISPWPGRTRLPDCPGPAGVIMRSIFGKLRSRPMPDDRQELLLCPPAFKGSHFMNWAGHAEVIDASHDWALKAIEALREQSDPAFEAMLLYSAKPRI